MTSEKIAVLIPCYNEASVIAQVVKSFKTTLPEATIYVYDNNSTDDTGRIAAQEGAIVRFEPRQGKGHVVRRMFSDIEANIYLMIDGDGTYDIASAPKLIEVLKTQHLDMVVGTRQENTNAHRPGHAWGNYIFNKILEWTFNSHFSDIFSGYRVFSKRFVKSFPALTQGFDIETEMSIHCLELNLSTLEIPTPFFERGAGTVSKLNTFRDGFKILWRILVLLRDARPLLCFGFLGSICAVLGLAFGTPILLHYFETKLVPRFPTAILATGLMILAFLNLYTGIILNSLSRQKRELKRLIYLNLSS